MKNTLSLIVEAIEKSNIKLFILLSVFLLGRKYLNLLSIIFVLISLACVVITAVLNERNAKISSHILISFFVFLAILLIVVLNSQYSLENTIISAAFLILAIWQFRKDSENTLFSSPKRDWFYAIILLWLTFFWIKTWLTGILTSEFFYLPSTWDKNYTGVVVFIFFCYCKKRGYILGKIVSLLYTVTLRSRMLLLAIVFIYLINIVNTLGNKSKFIHWAMEKISCFKTGMIFCTILILTIVTVLFSYFMVEYVPISNISQYQQSLNDKSNAIRVRANVYAVEQIMHDKNIFIRGYDNDIKQVLGVETENTAVMYKGFRLVQPHNLVLNMCLKNGVLFTLIYIILLSKLLSFWWCKENLPYLLPYLLMCMMVHSLMSTTYLYALLFMLACPFTVKQKHFVIKWKSNVQKVET